MIFESIISNGWSALISIVEKIFPWLAEIMIKIFAP